MSNIDHLATMNPRILDQIHPNPNPQGIMVGPFKSISIWFNWLTVTKYCYGMPLQPNLTSNTYWSPRGQCVSVTVCICLYAKRTVTEGATMKAAKDKPSIKTQKVHIRRFWCTGGVSHRTFTQETWVNPTWCQSWMVIVWKQIYYAFSFFPFPPVFDKDSCAC